jgi:hypothetical protein
MMQEIALLNTRAVSLKGLQSILRPDETVLEYVLDDPISFCLEISAIDRYLAAVRLCQDASDIGRYLGAALLPKDGQRRPSKPDYHSGWKNSSVAVCRANGPRLQVPGAVDNGLLCSIGQCLVHSAIAAEWAAGTTAIPGRSSFGSTGSHG